MREKEIEERPKQRKNETENRCIIYREREGAINERNRRNKAKIGGQGWRERQVQYVYI